MVLKIILALLMIGNIFGMVTIYRKPDLFLEKYPKLSLNALRFINLLPLFSLIGIAGIWFWQIWGVVLAIVVWILIILADIWYGIYYHIIVSLVSGMLAAWFIYKDWQHFV